MKRLFARIKPDIEPNKQRTEGNISILGSWRLVLCTDNLGNEERPRWKEVWSFATMDEEETNGVYVCDYINLHSFVGKWFLEGFDRIRLVRKEYDNDYFIVELTSRRLILKPHTCNCCDETLTFERVV